MMIQSVLNRVYGTTIGAPDQTDRLIKILGWALRETNRQTGTNNGLGLYCAAQVAARNGDNELALSYICMTVRELQFVRAKGDWKR